MDELHASVRMLGKEGAGFRQVVTDFAFLSPSMAIQYNFQSERLGNLRA